MLLVGETDRISALEFPGVLINHGHFQEARSQEAGWLALGPGKLGGWRWPSGS